MPLLQVQQVKKALAESGVRGSEDVKKLLEIEGLGPSEVIAELGSAMRSAENSHIKLKAIDTALKLNGLMHNNDGVSIPVVNIVINDSEFSGQNPILIPRSE